MWFDVFFEIFTIFLSCICVSDCVTRGFTAYIYKGQAAILRTAKGVIVPIVHAARHDVILSRAHRARHPRR